MKVLLLVFLALSTLFAHSIRLPFKTFKAAERVTDLVYVKNKLYASTTAGEIDVFNIQTQKIVQKIKIAKIKDFMGDTIDAKIYSVDLLDDSVLLLSQAKSSYNKVSLYENSQLKTIIGLESKLPIAKAKFLNKNTIILALLSNDIISYDIKTKKRNWTTQASMSKFSNFALNEDKSKIVISDESGDLHILDTTNGKNIQTLSAENLDNVFAVDYKNNTIATAGKDRRTVIYDLNFHSAYYKTSSFLIYAVGLSPSAKLAAYSSDEKNNISVFKTNTKSVVAVFGGIKMTPTKILFLNENEFLVASDDKVINLYKIK